MNAQQGSHGYIFIGPHISCMKLILSGNFLCTSTPLPIYFGEYFLSLNSSGGIYVLWLHYSKCALTLVVMMVLIDVTDQWEQVLEHEPNNN